MLIQVKVKQKGLWKPSDPNLRKSLYRFCRNPASGDTCRFVFLTNQPFNDALEGVRTSIEDGTAGTSPDVQQLIAGVVHFAMTEHEVALDPAHVLDVLQRTLLISLLPLGSAAANVRNNLRGLGRRDWRQAYATLFTRFAELSLQQGGGRVTRPALAQILGVPVSGVPAFLLAVANRPSTAGVPLRIVLLARQVADWWRGLLARDDALRELLSQHEPVTLGPLPLQGPVRERVFASAAAAFADKLKKPVPTGTVDLRDERFGRMRWVHLAALAHVEGLPITADKLANTIVDHEQRFWVKQHQAELGQGLQAAVFKAAAARFVAAVTLRGGAGTREAAEALNKAVDGPALPGFVRSMRWLYPGPGADCYLGGLEPDLLGETLIARVPASPETPKAFLDQVFPSGDASPSSEEAAALSNAFVVLGRISLYNPGAEAWLRRLLTPDIPGRSLLAFAAA